MRGGDVAQVLANGFAEGSQLGLLAAGFGIVYSVRRVFHVFHGAVFVVAAYASVWAMTLAEGGLLPGLVAAIAAAALANMLVEWLAYRSLRARQGREREAVTVSLAAYITAVALLSITLGSAPMGVPPRFGGAAFVVGGVTLSRGQVVSLCGGVICLAAVWCARRSLFWLTFRAVSEDPAVAESLGLRVRAVDVGALLLSGGLAAVSAWCYTIDAPVSPTGGARAIVVGSFGLLGGGPRNIVVMSVLVGVLIGVVENASAFLLPGPWREPAAFVVAGAVAAFWRLAPKYRVA